MSTTGIEKQYRVAEQVSGALRSRISAIRTRCLSIGILAAVLWAVVVIAIAVLVAVWFDSLWDLSAAARIMAIRVAVLCGGLAALILGWMSSRRSAAVRLAHDLDRAGATGGEIVSGLNLAGQANHGSDITAGLAELAVSRAAQTAAAIPVRVAAPAQPILREIWVLAGLAVACTVIAVLMPGFARTQWNRFANPLDDVPPFSTLKISVAPGDAEIVFGEGLDVTATVSETPVDDLQLVLIHVDGRLETAPMFSGTENHWRSVLTRLTEPLQYFVRSGRARSEKFQISLITIPEIRDVSARVQPPPYTHLGATSGPIPAAGLAGLPGTAVTLFVSSNRPLRGGELRFLPAAGEPHSVTLAPTAEQPDTVAGHFEIREAGKFELQVTDVDGQNSRGSVSGSIVLLTDNRPFVRIASPREASLATPDATVPVVIEAEDDYGLSSLTLFRSLNDSVAGPHKLEITGTPTRWVDRSSMDLRDFGLKPGDVIKLFARVEDNDPAGAKGSESPVHSIHIISQEDFDSMLRQQKGFEAVMSKYRQIQREIEALANDQKALKEAIDKLPASEKSGANEAMRLGDAAAGARETSETIRKKIAQKIPIDVDKEINDRLKAMADELDAIADELEALKKQAEAGEISNEELQKAIAKLNGRLGGQQGDFDQQVMQPMTELAEVVHLMQLESEFAQLVLRQRDLADRSASLKDFDGGDDPDARRRLMEFAEDEAELYSVLVLLLEQIEDAANALPADEEFDELRESALDFVEAVANCGADQLMESAELKFSEFSGVKGHPDADQAATILERFVQRSEDMGQAGENAMKKRFAPTQSRPGLGNSLPQIAQMFGLQTGGGNLGGFSQRRTTANNIGLYGNQPLTPQTSEAGSGDRDADAAGSFYTNDQRIGLAGSQPSGADKAQTGSSAATIPSKYQRRAGEYFRRLADESGD